MRAYARISEDVLAIGNEWLERRVAARAAEPSGTIALVNKRTGRDYARAGSRELSFAVDGTAIDGSDLTVTSATARTDTDPVEGIVALRSGSPRLDVTVHFLCYADHPVVRKRVVITNRDSLALTLTDLAWEDLELLVDDAAPAEVWSDHFTRRDRSMVVSMDECALLVNDPARGEGFILASEAPGPLKRLEAYARGNRIAAGYNRDDETIFERVLAPGESFETAASFLLPFATPVPQDAIDHEYGAFVAAHLVRCDPARVPSVTVNTWQPFELDIDRARLLEQIDLASDLGVDAYQVDAGWYHRMGDWDVDRAKFPRGLEEIAERCRVRGLRFGLWIAVATVDEASEVARAHPEWLTRDASGEPCRHPTAGALTMCLDSPYRDMVLETISRLVARYRVELLKLDLSSIRNVYAPGRYSGCHASGHGHRSLRESYVRVMERLLALVSEIKRRHCECLVDLSYELYGVADGHDLGLTQVADQNWFTNLATPFEASLRREIYERGRVTRPWTLNFGGALLDHPRTPGYGLFSTLAAHAMFWGDLRRLDDATRAHYRRWFAWIKAQRARSDFYRYVQVSDIFPPPDAPSSRDYRHALPVARYGIAPSGIHPPAFEPWLRTEGETWDGVARLDPRGEGPIFLFRPAASRQDRFRLRIPWVDAAARYRAEDAVAERAMGTFSGAELREHGIEVRIAEPERAAVVVLSRA